MITNVFTYYFYFVKKSFRYQRMAILRHYRGVVLPSCGHIYVLQQKDENRIGTKNSIKKKKKKSCQAKGETQ